MGLFGGASATGPVGAIKAVFGIVDGDKLKSIDFGTVVDALGEGQIEGSASASKAGITDKTSAAYKNAFLKDLFLNKTAVLQADADNTSPNTSEFNYQKDLIRFEFQDGTANNEILFAAFPPLHSCSMQVTPYPPRIF